MRKISLDFNHFSVHIKKRWGQIGNNGGVVFLTVSRTPRRQPLTLAAPVICLEAGPTTAITAPFHEWFINS